MLIFERSHPGRRNAAQAPHHTAAASGIPAALLRQDQPLLPEASEMDVVRHYTRLSQKNFSIDTHFYPLGSCTMKYSPRACNTLAMLPNFLARHPLAPESTGQGVLACLYDLQKILKDVTGMASVSLVPMAGAQGEFAGIAIMRAYHDAGGLLYYDGANLNAILGKVKPGDMGFDVIHLNLHKTFSMPHGGGGPGAWAVGVAQRLMPFLPLPVVAKEEGSYCYITEQDLPQSIGHLAAFSGNIGILLRAYVYARMLGAEGMHRVAEFATLNANYLMVELHKAGFTAAFPQRRTSHEFIISMKPLKDTTGISAMDVAKRLLDKGFHPPTTYFPILVLECLLIEPTETESKETLDGFVAAMKEIRDEARAAHHAGALTRRREGVTRTRPDMETSRKHPRGLMHVWHATLTALVGLRATWQHEDAFRQEVLIAAIAIPVMLLLPANIIGKALIVASILLVLIVELLNSALEAAVDYTSLEQHPPRQTRQGHRQHGGAAEHRQCTGGMGAGAAWLRAYFSRFHAPPRLLRDAVQGTGCAV